MSVVTKLLKSKFGGAKNLMVIQGGHRPLNKIINRHGLWYITGEYLDSYRCGLTIPPYLVTYLYTHHITHVKKYTTDLETVQYHQAILQQTILCSNSRSRFLKCNIFYNDKEVLADNTFNPSYSNFFEILTFNGRKLTPILNPFRTIKGT